MTITWLDKGRGSWSLRSADKDGREKIVRIRKKDSGKWTRTTLALDGALYSGNTKRPDLTLQHEDGDDTLFHMIELERTP